MVLFVETDVGALLQPIGQPDAEPMDAVAFLTNKLAAIDMSIPDSGLDNSPPDIDEPIAKDQDAGYPISSTSHAVVDALLAAQDD